MFILWGSLVGLPNRDSFPIKLNRTVDLKHKRREIDGKKYF